MHYQPQIDIDSGDMVGMEALVRWIHPQQWLLLPYSFLPFAHDTGLIIPLDQWGMKTATQQYAQWYHDGFQPGVLAINLSIRQIKQKNFVGDMQRLLKETGCQPDWIELEVTENQIMKDPELAIKLLKQISELGISLAIDVFGRGFSSLSQLKRLPISKLKVDPSFVQNLPLDEDATISKSVISLAHYLGLNVIAEEVETLQQKSFLQLNGCNYIQGNYYSHPLAAKDMMQQMTKPVKVG